MLKLRPALTDDLPQLWPLVQRAVAGMNAQDNPQWGADYPTLAHYQGDLARGELFVALRQGVLLGCACINTDEAPEYAPLPWGGTGPAVVLHRLAVEPSAQRQGVGRALFGFAEQLAGQWGLSSLRIDTYEQNHAMQRLILSCGFRPVGQVQFGRAPQRPLGYPCFEKFLLLTP